VQHRSRISVGAGLGTKIRYSPITFQQNPPSPPITELVFVGCRGGFRD